MIKVRIISESPANPKPPPITFPFLYRSHTTGIIYLRFKNEKEDSKDMRIKGSRTYGGFGEVSDPNWNDGIAWSNRLINEEVVLSNELGLDV